MFCQNVSYSIYVLDNASCEHMYWMENSLGDIYCYLIVLVILVFFSDIFILNGSTGKRLLNEQQSKGCTITS